MPFSLLFGNTFLQIGIDDFIEIAAIKNVY
jgi:hypothetical protein